MANQMNALDVTWRMVKDTLSCEVIETSLFWLEFKANNGERLPRYHTYIRECFESFSRVLKYLEIYRSVTSINYLDCLICRFIYTNRWENNFIRWTDFNHGDKRLGTWWERMAD